MPTYFTSNSASAKKVSEAIDRLRAKKQSLRLSNKQISENSKGALSESAVQRFFSGEMGDPSMQTFFEVASALGMTSEEAFGIKQPEPLREAANHDNCQRVAELKEHYLSRIADLKDHHREYKEKSERDHAATIHHYSIGLLFLSIAFLALVVIFIIFMAYHYSYHDELIAAQSLDIPSRVFLFIRRLRNAIV